MPTTLGTASKTLFLKQNLHLVTEEFEVKELTTALAIDADLVASNSTVVTVNGLATSATVYASSHDATMAAIAVKVAALSGVRSATAAARTITIEMESQVAAPVISAVTSSGSSQGAWTATADNNAIYPGQPVKLTTDGKVEPLAAAGNLVDNIGHSLHQGYGRELVTVVMRAQTIIFAEATAANGTAAPVKTGTFNTVSSRARFDDASVTHENYVGWALDPSTDIDEEIRVALL